MAKDKVRKPTQTEQKELDELMKEITNLSKEMIEDYTKNPSKMSGSITQVHESSPYVATREERLYDYNMNPIRDKKDKK